MHRGVERGPSGQPWGRAAVVAGLLAVAVTQPVLDLLGRNPEFFVAGPYTSTQILLFGVIVALVPSAVAAVVLVSADWLHPVAGRCVFGLLLALFGALFGNVLVRGLGLDGWLVAATATLLGAVAAVVLARRRAPRLLLQYLAVANVLFLVAFVALSPASDLVSGTPAGDVGHVAVPELPGPVVVIVFDELPLTTLLRADGTLNAARYPAFAALGERATWYRNASSTHPDTDKALPSLMSGNLPTDTLPTYREHPRNILSLFGQAVPVHRYEPLTDLCPPDLCEPRPPGSLSTALLDAAVVYGHRTLPEDLRDSLPSIDSSWGGFGDELGGSGVATAPHGSDAFANAKNGFVRWAGRSDLEHSPAYQAATLVERARAIDASPSLHFVHVVLPHRPWVVTPWGTRVVGEPPDWVGWPVDLESDWTRRLRYQLHSLQAGAADAALGQVIATLDEADLWDDATLVVMADHGYSLLPPDYGREPTPANADEVYRVPLFIKTAGQTAGSTVDDPAQIIDVLPTLVDVLDIETDWQFDGHSLADGSRPTAELTVRPSVLRALAAARRHEADFPHGDDWTALAATGENGGLVGTSLDDLTVGESSAITWEIDQAATLADLPTAQGEVPYVLTGTVRVPDGGHPPKLVVVVNGVVAGVVEGYHQPIAGVDGRDFATFLAPFFHDGANELTAYEVEATSAGPVLHAVR